MSQQRRQQQVVGSTPSAQPIYHTIIGASSSVTNIPSLDGIYNGGAPASSVTTNNPNGGGHSNTSNQDNSS